MNEPHQFQQEVSTAIAIIEEICDGSDIRFYQNIEELHSVLPSTWETILIQRLSSIGWKLKWRKERIRFYPGNEKPIEIWNRLAFTFSKS